MQIFYTIRKYIQTLFFYFFCFLLKRLFVAEEAEQGFHAGHGVVDLAASASGTFSTAHTQTGQRYRLRYPAENRIFQQHRSLQKFLRGILYFSCSGVLIWYTGYSSAAAMHNKYA